LVKIKIQPCRLFFNNKCIIRHLWCSDGHTLSISAQQDGPTKLIVRDLASSRANNQTLSSVNQSVLVDANGSIHSSCSGSQTRTTQPLFLESAYVTQEPSVIHFPNGLTNSNNISPSWHRFFRLYIYAQPHVCPSSQYEMGSRRRVTERVAK